MPQVPISREQALAEVESVLRDTPPQSDFEQHLPNTNEWTGRAVAAIGRWDDVFVIRTATAVNELLSFHLTNNVIGLRRMLMYLQQARADLRMEVGAATFVIPKGQVFDYFNEVRKLIELAQTDVLFVDRYLNADFVSRYLPHVRVSATARLLLFPKYAAQIVPAAEMFMKQSGLKIEVRSSADIHGRWLLVDRAQAFLSDASFKDGPHSSSAVLRQELAGFAEVAAEREREWAAGKVEFA